MSREAGPVYLLSAEGALPGRRVSQQKTLDLAQAQNASSPRQKKLLKAVYQKVGVQARYSVLNRDFFVGDALGTQERMLRFEKEAPKLAYAASHKAIQAAGIVSKSIGHLVSVSCTGFAAPGFDISVLKSLKLDPSLSRTHIGFMGCHGIFNAMRVAAGLVQPDQDALVCSVELCSLHYRHGGDLRQMLGNSLFSDGAGAAIVSTEKHSPNAWRIAAQGSTVIPDSEGAITWRIGDLGFEMGLSQKIRGLIQKNLRDWLERWLTKENIKLKDIRSWAVHPGGPGVLDAVEKSLDLPKDALERSRSVLRSHGNMSSATILFILHELMLQKGATPCLALGFGPGVTIEAALFL
ncbi:MAG: type III polyketide synthase [Candidatus Omnitrophica bacterium]|nr:type III polyketide synthase [Candidatus Omnitrophota bacterium]